METLVRQLIVAGIVIGVFTTIDLYGLYRYISWTREKEAQA